MKIGFMMMMMMSARQYFFGSNKIIKKKTFKIEKSPILVFNLILWVTDCQKRTTIIITLLPDRLFYVNQNPTAKHEKN